MVVAGRRVTLTPVGKGSHKRRPSGHPAKVARRREREAARRSAAGPGKAAIARRIVADVESLTSALDAELWASHMLGTMWEERTDLPLDEAHDYAVVYGAPLVEAIARVDSVGALTALRAIAEVDDGDLGVRATELATHWRGHGEPPAWLADVGRATIMSAAIMREDVFEDGFTMFLEARHPGGDTHAVGVYIDNNLGVMAKDILFADSIDAVGEVLRQNPAPDGEVLFEAVDPALAAAEIAAAMELTEMTWDPPVSEDYAALRALAQLRADETPGRSAPRDRDELPDAEREALLREFLRAPEGRGFTSEGDEAFAASLAIDFCVDYVDGRPLRWSAVVVELFMADWLPRKVLADTELLSAVPAALEAWVRFAGRKRGIPQWAVDATCQAIPQWRDEMVSAAGDPASGGPAKQFLTAAQEAGIDVSDQKALTTFMAGWNARSTVA